MASNREREKSQMKANDIEVGKSYLIDSEVYQCTRTTASGALFEQNTHKTRIVVLPWADVFRRVTTLR